MKKNLLTKEEPPIRLRYYFLGSVVLWSILIGLSLAWNLRSQESGILEAARIEARAGFDKDVVYRRWNATCGGVYVPVTEVTQPNPYLDVLERDITTSLGKELTKINPAYMTRQVHELALKAYGIRGHITSLDPIRPANAPDTWETRALKAFQTGLKEVSSVEEIEGSDYMRLMRPLLTEQSCLKCHATQGYKLGDIRGGISVSTPMAPLMAIAQSHILALCVGHGLLWLAGLVGIGLSFRRLNQQIHKRMGVEVALWESEAQKEAILDGITSNLAFVNENLEILWANKASSDSVNRNPDEMIGHKCHEFWADPNAPCDGCPTIKAFKTKRSEQTIMHTPDGKVWEEKGEPVFDRKGVVIGVVKIAHDVTSRVQAEEALQKAHDELEEQVKERTNKLSKANEELKVKNMEHKRTQDALVNQKYFLQKAQEIGQIGTWELDIKKNELLWTDETYRIFGLPIGTKLTYEIFLDCVHPDDREYVHKEWNAAFDRKPYDIEHRLLVDGKIKWVREKAELQFNEKNECIRGTGFAQDITDSKLAEEALRKSEKRYRELINSITDFIYSHDLEGRFITVNRVAAKTLGYTPENLIGRPISDFMLREHRQAFKDEYLAHIKEKGSSDGVTIYVAKDGSKHYIEYRNVLLKQEGMEPFVTGSGRDITEKILSEHKMQKLQEQLHRSQKMEAMGLMAGGIAHDLNNILSGIVSYPELLLMDIPIDSPMRKPMETIMESGMRAADVVTDLMTIARGVASSKEVLNFNTVAEKYLNSTEHKNLVSIRPSVTFKTQFDSDLLNVNGSPTHMKKTLMNLVINASEAIEGSGTVTISTMNQYLDEPLRGYEHVVTGEYVMLTVSDDGSGISQQDLERIFEPFYTKKVMDRSGTGLGLAVVWNAIQDHDGYIDVKSSEKGTVFELYFPVTREEVAAEKEEVPPEDYLGHGEKILVVDDEERQREIASGILTRLGYNAETVSSGEEAIEYVKKHPVDLLLLDMVMPKGINGRKTYEKIIRIRPEQKAIIASGFAKTKEVDIAQELGAGKYIKKPYTLAKVGVAVKEELEK